ncbi:MAG: hydantoinase/oxoprolinase family protein [Ectothiorhodospiraceae bacterium]|nr:hydantoinase/oxoprolinase family protein [Ectothiorhodospiraceae bacterium]
MPRSVRIAVDIGGTFTDLVALDSDGGIATLKVASTPAAPEAAVLDGVARLLERVGLAAGDVREVVHGTTVGSNTLLQKVGAPTGLVTTRGFRDVLEIGRLRTPGMFDLGWDKPEPLVRRRFRLEVDERIAADGSVVRALDEAQVADAGRALERAGITSVAVCFVNSYRNPAHEVAAERVLRRACPSLAVTTSVSVLPEMREYERVSTAVVNAYVLPVLASYLQRLEDGLRAIGIEAPVLVANSNGGLAAAATARAKPVFFVSSGRSAGVVGAAALGTAVGTPDLVVFDMGGTTASAALVHAGEVSRSNEYEFRAGMSTPSRFIKAGGYLMRVPTVDVAEVGSGAGSIARVDPGGLLEVGPRSAGAVPGPACYGAGGEQPTVTDANVVLGYLPTTLAGGTLPLDPARARAALETHVAGPLGLTVEAAAHGIREVVNANMARAIRAVTVERGLDPRDFTLLAFGGSGPAHACDLATALSIRRVLFPRAPGVFTATGMLAGDVERYFIRAWPGMLHDLDVPGLDRAMAELAREARAALAAEGFDDDDSVSLAFELDLRFVGQDSELGIRLPTEPGTADRAALREAFLAAYRALYQYASSDAVETVNLRLVGRGVRASKVDFAAVVPVVGDAGGASGRSRPVWFGRDRGALDTPVRDRDALVGTFDGPMVIEGADATIVVPPGAHGRVDPAGNIVVELLEGE